MKAGKAGVWDIRPDGSGTWAREDKAATRFSTLWKTGPARHEVHKRVTYDLDTGQVIGTLLRFDVAKNLNDELPPPVPRNIRSVFHFHSTQARVPDPAEQSIDVAAVGIASP